MAAPSSTEAFLSLVKQSGLVGLPRLQEYVQERLNSGGIPASARRIAQDMLSDGLLTKFQAEQILMGHYRKFEVAGKYRLLERVGEGGAAAVYLCEHLILKRPVALKILPSWKTKSPEIVARFLREARAAAMVDHPNIVRVHDVEAADQNYFLVTEFVDGPNLETLVEATGPLAPARAARYIYEAALALQHAHEVGLVHRDVKPSNLLVDQSGHVKLLDLGLVKLTQIDDGLTQTLEGKAVLGTIDFQAPEQAVDSSDVDIRADIYSLGASFFFLLTGQVVFPEGTVAQKLSWHQQRTPPSLRDIRSEIPDRMARIVARMLAKDPRARFQEPGQIAEALEPWSREPAQPLEDFELPKMSRAARVFLANWAARGNPEAGVAPARSRRLTPQRISILDRSTPGPPFVRIRSNNWPRAAAVVVAGLLTMLTLPAWIPWELNRSGEGEKSGSVVETSWIEPVGPPSNRPINTASLPEHPKTTATIRLLSKDQPPRTQPSVQTALDQAANGDRIEIEGTHLRESVRWTNRPGVTLTSANPDRTPVLWEPAGRVGDHPCCLLVQGSESATIQGFRLDGGATTATLIRVLDACPGLLLENLEFQGAARPLALRATSGSVDRPEILRGLRFLQADDSAIIFEPGTEDPDIPCRSIHIECCRFEGPSTAAIRINAPTEAIEVRSCRFFGLDDGLRYSEEAFRASLGVALLGNTFRDVRRGLHFELTPPPTSRLAVRNNLFTKTDTLAQTDGLKVQPAWAPEPSAWIWTDEGEPGSARVPPGERPFRKTFTWTDLPDQAILEVSADESFEAWINGEPAGKSIAASFDQRVRAFDVTRLLRPGANVLAILVTNHADPFRPDDHGTTAGLMARLTGRSDSREVQVLVTDATWKTSRSSPKTGWQALSFDDRPWESAHTWGERTGLAEVWPWTRTTWDAQIADQLRDPSSPIVVEVGGNVRDEESWEGYPNLAATRAMIHDRDLPLSAADDAQFLRYARRHPLFRAGIDGAPVGLPRP